MNVEGIWPEEDREFDEEVVRWAWVEEMLKGEWQDQCKRTQRRNVRQQCKELCSSVLRKNQLFCLCFCGKHRELCPTHKVVEPFVWSKKRNETSGDQCGLDPSSRNSEPKGVVTNEAD